MAVLSALRRFIEGRRPDPQADPAKMRGIGERVRAHLAANQQIEAIGGGKADLFCLRGFLSEAECRKLIEVIDGKVKRSVLYSDKQAPAGRTSSTHFFEASQKQVQALAAKIASVTGIDPVHAEPLQGQRYLEGQEYRRHCDFFHTDKPYWQVERGRGGQRSWTAMVYLNAVGKGGGTEFPALDLTIAPEPGMLVLWDNMTRKGRPNRAMVHAALPVTSGRKYVVTQWYRQGGWSLSQRGGEVPPTA